jgi:hypothetical protein
VARAGLTTLSEADALQAELDRFFGVECTAADVRAARSGFSERLWAEWQRLGPYDLVGGDSRLELAVAACTAGGAALAPIPMAESLTAMRLLDRLDGDAARGLIEASRQGKVVTLAPEAPAEGWLPHVPGGAIATCALYFNGDAIRATSDEPGSPTGALAQLPVARRQIGDADPVLGLGDLAAAAWARAIQEWRILVVAMVVGAGRRSLELAVGYARTRQQFGSPIGGFQAVAHSLADLAAEQTGAELLLRSTCAELDGLEDVSAHPDSWRVDQLVYFATTAAEHVVTEGLHYHGGYGFTLEQDIQLYLRYIKAWTLLLGGSHAALVRAAHGRGWVTAD